MEPTFSRIESIKLNFFLRLTKNDLMNEFIRKIAQEHTSSGNESLTKRSLMCEIMNYTNDDILNEGERVKLVKEKLSEIKHSHKQALNCGIVDSVRSCLADRTEANYKILNLLIQSFVKIPRDELARRRSQRLEN
jgi:hypothetical protein